jgi:hypothetical protein
VIFLGWRPVFPTCSVAKQVIAGKVAGAGIDKDTVVAADFGEGAS